MEIKRETKNCPYCGEEILAVARKCKFCGEWLDKEAVSAISTQENGPETKEPAEKKVEPTVNTISSTETKTFFKDFWTSKSLRFNLIILCLVWLVSLFLVSSVSLLLAQILSALLSFAMTILIVQRVVENRSKTDLITWMAIGGSIFWTIGTYVAYDTCYSNPLNAIGLARVDDGSEFGMSMRFFFDGGFVWFLLSGVLDCISRFMMWQNAYSKLKSTMIMGLIAAIIETLFIVLVRNSSEQVILISIIIFSLSTILYYIMMICVNDTGVKGNNSDSTKSSGVGLLIAIIVIAIVGIGVFFLITQNNSHSSSSDYNTSTPSSVDESSSNDNVDLLETINKTSTTDYDESTDESYESSPSDVETTGEDAVIDPSEYE